MYIARARCKSQLAVRSSGLNVADHRDGLSSSSFLAWSSIAQSVCQRAINLLANRCLKTLGASVITGITQGTVLGPLLFLLYINDLPLNVRSQVWLFAEDCALYRPINSSEDQEVLQQDLRSLEQWGFKSGMRFNASKCEFIRISRGRTAHTQMYSLGGIILKQVSQAKYLGVTIMEDLTWSPHISNRKS